MTFAEGFLGLQAKAASKSGRKTTVFDWDKAAEIIKDRLLKHPDLYAEAGLQGDWENTAGCIFEDGKPTNGEYMFLASNWAVPTLILAWDGIDQEEIECFTDQSDRFDLGTKWDVISLEILGIPL